ncbi:hypothetical protein Xind_01735 [Xenorhabdus indica]|nr:hypothetical protein [Xenorhabdus indica]
MKIINQQGLIVGLIKRLMHKFFLILPNDFAYI